jgi:hypothetical protein
MFPIRVSGVRIEGQVMLTSALLPVLRRISVISSETEQWPVLTETRGAAPP